MVMNSTVNFGDVSTSSRQHQKSRVMPQFTLVLDQLFPIFLYAWPRPRRIVWENMLFPLALYHLQLAQGYGCWTFRLERVCQSCREYRHKVRMSIGHEAVDVLWFRKCYFRRRLSAKGAESESYNKQKRGSGHVSMYIDMYVYMLVCFSGFS